MNRRIYSIFMAVLFVSSALVAKEPVKPVSPQKEKQIREMLEVVGMQALVNQMVDQMFESYKVSMPNVPPATWDKIAKKMRGGDLIELMVPLYDRYYSEEDLRAILAFYRTPTGRRMVETLPAITQEAMQIGQQWGERKSIEVIREIEAERPKPDETARNSPETSRTMSDLRSLATASEAYATDHNKYPAATNLKELEKVISPIYIRTVPKMDAWGKPFLYVATKDLQVYRFVSGGPDGKIEAANRQVGAKEKKKNDDLIYENGYFMQAPGSE